MRVESELIGRIASFSLCNLGEALIDRLLTSFTLQERETRRERTSLDPSMAASIILRWLITVAQTESIRSSLSVDPPNRRIHPTVDDNLTRSGSICNTEGINPAELERRQAGGREDPDICDRVRRLV